jgi:glycosyltransferase involved in cell wall biosynthesis
MHGQHKLSNEGYRTRDGHIIEWLGRLADGAGTYIDVVSRPEPILIAPLQRLRGPVAVGTVPTKTLTWRIPNLDRKRWWMRSADAYPKIDAFGAAPAIAWNPFLATAPPNRSPFSGGRTVVMDLLDDWTIHYGFASIRDEAEYAYRRAFEVSDVVIANSEGTLDLAHRLGRSDAELVTNGVDPERFAVAPCAKGPLTIGYVGKIGQRLDAQLLRDVCSSFSGVRFVFAGPFLDPGDKYRALLSNFPNVELLGDVHYDELPALMATFDLGWVPHAVGKGEVGGDVLKTYEYRASSLQVLTTPVRGAGRTLTEGVHIVPASEQVAWLHEAVRGRERLDRIPADIPVESTWSYKAQFVANALGLKLAR